MLVLLVCLKIVVNVGSNADEWKFLRQWKMEACYGPKNGWDYSTREIHYDRCCLLPGKYTLTCVNNKTTYGWGDAFLEIAGKRYCDDFIGFKAMRTVSVIGILKFEGIFFAKVDHRKTQRNKTIMFKLNILNSIATTTVSSNNSEPQIYDSYNATGMLIVLLFVKSCSIYTISNIYWRMY